MKIFSKNFKIAWKITNYLVIMIIQIKSTWTVQKITQHFILNNQFKNVIIFSEVNKILEEKNIKMKIKPEKPNLKYLIIYYLGTYIGIGDYAFKNIVKILRMHTEDI